MKINISSESMENFIKDNAKDQYLTVIRPKLGLKLLGLKELLAYKDLFYFMVARNIKAAYAQTVLGFSWAILQPLIQILLFTIIFGKVAKVPTEGIPYSLFTAVAIIPWTYLSQAMMGSSQSLVTNKQILAKVYFPRFIYPITPVLACLVNFGISLLILMPILFYYQVKPTFNLLLLPIFFLQLVLIPLAIGLWLSALAIRYRDVQHAMQFLIRLLMFSAPIVYSASSIPQKYRIIYSFNPVVGVIEGFRACLLGTTIPWQFIGPSFITTIFLLISGAYYFKQMEHVFVDVI